MRCTTRPDEVDVIDILAHVIPDEAQARQGLLDQRPRCLGPLAQLTVICLRVIPDQGPVDDGHPPDGLTDHGEGPWLVQLAGSRQPVRDVAHRGD
jgi:hypothetical protein